MEIEILGGSEALGAEDRAGAERELREALRTYDCAYGSRAPAVPDHSRSAADSLRVLAEVTRRISAAAAHVLLHNEEERHGEIALLRRRPEPLEAPARRARSFS